MGSKQITMNILNNIKLTNVTSVQIANQLDGMPTMDCLVVINDSDELIDTQKGIIKDMENDGEVLMANSLKCDLSVMQHNLETFKGAYKILMN